MNTNALLSLCEQGVDAALAAGADEAEVYASFSTELTVGLEKNDLHQVRTVSETTFGLRVIRQGSIGFATSNQPDTLAAAAKEAVALATVGPPDPLNGLPDPANLAPAADAVDPALLELDAGKLAPLAMTLLKEALGRDARLTIDTGAVSVEENHRAIVSSKGVRASFHDAAAGGYLFGMCVDGDAVGSFSYDGDQVRRAADLEEALSSAFARFVKRCVGALHPTKGESFRGTIVLPPETVHEFLLGNLLGALNADAVRTGQSPLGDRMGDTVAHPGFSLTEGGTGLPGFVLSPFDREGLPRQRTPLVSDGVLTDFLYNAYEARAAGRASNGHAAGGPASQPSVGAACLTLAPGTDTIDGLQALDRGILVTRFSGSTNAATGDFSGVVKGGFLIRDGEKRPIDETTLAGNLYDCLKSISGISQETRRIQGTTEVPWIRIDDVSITAG
jgi:PmbA protein